MPDFILVGKVVPLESIKSDFIMSFPAQTINKTCLNYFAILVQIEKKTSTYSFYLLTGFVLIEWWEHFYQHLRLKQKKRE